jgi:hypothetical protein
MSSFSICFSRGRREFLPPPFRQPSWAPPLPSFSLVIASHQDYLYSRRHETSTPTYISALTAGLGILLLLMLSSTRQYTSRSLGAHVRKCAVQNVPPHQQSRAHALIARLSHSSLQLPLSKHSHDRHHRFITFSPLRTQTVTRRISSVSGMHCPLKPSVFFPVSSFFPNPLDDRYKSSPVVPDPASSHRVSWLTVRSPTRCTRLVWHTMYKKGKRHGSCTAP